MGSEDTDADTQGKKEILVGSKKKACVCVGVYAIDKKS